MLTPPSGELAKFVRGQGGAEDLLFGGRGRTRRIEADLGLQRPQSKDYREWLGECSTGEMWEKNLLRGYP